MTTKPNVAASPQATLPLGDRSPTAITATVQINWDTARTLYELTGPRVSGAITLTPSNTPLTHEIIPHAVRVSYGNLLTVNNSVRQFTRNTHYPDPTTVNGIAALGYTTAQIATIHDGSFTTWTRRTTAAHSTARLPTASEDLLTRVVRAVLRHWLQQPEAPDLRLIIARRAVPARIEQYQQKINRLRGEIRRLTGQASEAERLSTELEVFLTQGPTPQTRAGHDDL